MSQTTHKPLLYEMNEDAAQTSASSAENIVYKDDGLLSIAGPIMVLCYVLMFGIAAVTFFSSTQALFVLTICSGFAVLYFSLPYLFMRIRSGRDGRFQRDAVKAHDPMVEVGTGSIHRWEAIVQILSVPVAIVIGFSLFAIRWSLL